MDQANGEEAGVRLEIGAGRIVITGVLIALVLTVSLAISPVLAEERLPELIPADATKILATTKTPGTKATLVNVWASFCVPCRAEFPAMLEVWREFRGQGLQLVLVTTDLKEDQPAALKFLAKQGVTFPTYVKAEPDQKFIEGLHAEWSGSIPATLIYDHRGELVSFWEGEGSKSEFRAAVKRALRIK
jgi:thiol-disulfide isomerase/thioredoxin